MQGCDDQHHNNMQHSEISYKGYLPYPHSLASNFTHRLQQFTTHGSTIGVNNPSVTLQNTAA